MTTIAWCAASKTMAADTQMTSCNRKFRCTKVYRLPDGGLFGGTGSAAQIMKVLRWAAGGFDAEAKPEIGDDEGDGIECIVVTGKGRAFLLQNDLEPLALRDRFVAIGSGGCVAMGAMGAMGYGADPVSAVKIAARFDAATSGPVQKWTLPASRKKK